MKRFKDLADLDEDRRIAEIVAAVKKMQKVAFITDMEPPDKAARYITKIKGQLAGQEVQINVIVGKPINNVVTVIVTLVKPENN